MMIKEKYEKTEFDIILFQTEDVIMISGEEELLDQDEYEKTIP